MHWCFANVHWCCQDFCSTTLDSLSVETSIALLPDPCASALPPTRNLTSKNKISNFLIFHTVIIWGSRIIPKSKFIFTFSLTRDTLFLLFTGGNFCGPSYCHPSPSVLWVFCQLWHHPNIPPVDVLHFLCQVLLGRPPPSHLEMLFVCLCLLGCLVILGAKETVSRHVLLEYKLTHTCDVNHIISLHFKL